MTEIFAQPQFARGDKVRYHDHTGRLQTGKVTRIQANWLGHSEAGSAPHITYTITHPTYPYPMYTNADNMELV